MQTKKRSTIIAPLLSFLLPGLGQAYNGRFFRGFIFFTGAYSVLIFTSLFGFKPFIIGLISTTILSILIIYDAFRLSKNLVEIDLKYYNRWYFYVLIYIFSTPFQLAAKDLFLRYETYRVPVGSMMKTILPGDCIFSDKHAYGLSLSFLDLTFFETNVKRGDVVIFPYPENPEIDFIKRVVAIGGDKLKISGEKVFINGVKENGNYLFFDSVLYPLRHEIEITIPEGKLWVMGDNRRNSKDSRYWSFVDKKSVKGKAESIYWSHNPAESLFSGYRWDRIGMKISSRL